MRIVFSLAVCSLVFGETIDTQCGVKLFHNDVAKDVFSRLTLEGFAFDVELLFLARKLGYQVFEVPLVWRNDPRTTVRMWKDPAKMLLDLLKIRWRHQDLTKKVKG
jgi:dolichyl-phosphate beta-glucosyltransferase